MSGQKGKGAQSKVSEGSMSPGAPLDLCHVTQVLILPVCHRDLDLSSPSPLPCHIHKKPHCGLTLGVQWLSCHIIIFWFLTHLFWTERAFFSTFHSDERWIPPLVVPAQYNPQLIADHISASDQHFHLPKTITATQLPCSVRNKTENCHFL